MIHKFCSAPWDLSYIVLPPFSLFDRGPSYRPFLLDRARRVRQLVISSGDLSVSPRVSRGASLCRARRRAGGVTADDRVEVQPWIEKEGRLVHSMPWGAAREAEERAAREAEERAERERAAAAERERARAEEKRQFEAARARRREEAKRGARARIDDAARANREALQAVHAGRLDGLRELGVDISRVLAAEQAARGSGATERSRSL